MRMLFNTLFAGVLCVSCSSMPRAQVPNLGAPLFPTPLDQPAFSADRPAPQSPPANFDPGEFLVFGPGTFSERIVPGLPGDAYGDLAAAINEPTAGYLLAFPFETATGEIIDFIDANARYIMDGQSYLYVNSAFVVPDNGARLIFIETEDRTLILDSATLEAKDISEIRNFGLDLASILNGAAKVDQAGLFSGTEVLRRVGGTDSANAVRIATVLGAIANDHLTNAMAFALTEPSLLEPEFWHGLDPFWTVPILSRLADFSFRGYGGSESIDPLAPFDPGVPIPRARPFFWPFPEERVRTLFATDFGFALPPVSLTYIDLDREVRELEELVGDGNVRVAAPAWLADGLPPYEPFFGLEVQLDRYDGMLGIDDLSNHSFNDQLALPGILEAWCASGDFNLADNGPDIVIVDVHALNASLAQFEGGEQCLDEYASRVVAFPFGLDGLVPLSRLTFTGEVHSSTIARLLSIGPALASPGTTTDRQSFLVSPATYGCRCTNNTPIEWLQMLLRGWADGPNQCVGNAGADGNRCAGVFAEVNPAVTIDLISLQLGQPTADGLDTQPRVGFGPSRWCELDAALGCAPFHVVSYAHEADLLRFFDQWCVKGEDGERPCQPAWVGTSDMLHFNEDIRHDLDRYEGAGVFLLPLSMLLADDRFRLNTLTTELSVGTDPLHMALSMRERASPLIVLTGERSGLSPRVGLDEILAGTTPFAQQLVVVMHTSGLGNLLIGSYLDYLFKKWLPAMSCFVSSAKLTTFVPITRYLR